MILYVRNCGAWHRTDRYELPGLRAVRCRLAPDADADADRSQGIDEA